MFSLLSWFLGASYISLLIGMVFNFVLFLVIVGVKTFSLSFCCKFYGISLVNIFFKPKGLKSVISMVYS